MKLTLGIDPGARKLGLSWVNFETMEAKLQTIDISTWGSTKHDISWTDYGQCIDELFSSMKALFSVCECVGIEKLPPVITEDGIEKATSLDIHAIMIYMEQTIRIRYPHILIFYIAPQSYQSVVGSGKGGSRIQNKKNSWKTNTLPEYNKIEAIKLYGELHPDSLEATHVAIYVHLFKAFLMQTQLEFSGPRQFAKKEYTTPINLPPSEGTKKKLTDAYKRLKYSQNKKS